MCSALRSLAALLAGFIAARIVMLPPSTWFWIASLTVFLPASYAGARLALAR
jgi:hypothetical protein